MKYAHLIKLSVFSYGHENSEEIKNAFLELFPFSLEANGLAIKITDASGFNEEKIRIFEAELAKDSLINEFLDNLLNNLGKGQKERILTEAESRLGSDFNFFIRIGKNSWVNGRRMILTDSGKCFHVKISIAAFPKKRGVALNIVKKMLSK